MRAVLRLWPAATVPAFALNVGAVKLATALGHPPSAAPLADFGSRGLLLDLALVVAVAPVVETLLMGLLLALLRRLAGPGPAAAIASGLAWGLMHSLAVPLWGVPTGWIFFVLSAAYLSWRECSLPHAIGVASAVHALNNATGLALALL